MTRVAPATHDPVEVEDRRPFKKADVDAVFELQDGCCALCPARLGRTFVRDHRRPRAQGGKTDRANLDLICVGCAAKKDPADNSRTAKAKRQAKLMQPKAAPKRPIRSRGFAPGKRKMASRPMRKKP